MIFLLIALIPMPFAFAQESDSNACTRLTRGLIAISDEGKAQASLLLRNSAESFKNDKSGIGAKLGGDELKLILDAEGRALRLESVRTSASGWFSPATEDKTTTHFAYRNGRCYIDKITVSKDADVRLFASSGLCRELRQIMPSHDSPQFSQRVRTVLEKYDGFESTPSEAEKKLMFKYPDRATAQAHLYLNRCGGSEAMAMSVTDDVVWSLPKATPAGASRNGAYGTPGAQ